MRRKFRSLRMITWSRHSLSNGADHTFNIKGFAMVIVAP